MEAWFTIGLGAIGFVVNVIVLAIGGTWALARHGRSIEASISQNRKEIDTEIAKLRETLQQEHDEFMQRFGDSLIAIRAKINEVELWARDEFIRRQDFYRIVDGINKSIGELGDKIEAGVDKLDLKIDQLRATH